jgi:hypothetical protein
MQGTHRDNAYVTCGRNQDNDGLLDGKSQARRIRTVQKPKGITTQTTTTDIPYGQARNERVAYDMYSDMRGSEDSTANPTVTPCDCSHNIPQSSFPR